MKRLLYRILRCAGLVRLVDLEDAEKALERSRAQEAALHKVLEKTLDQWTASNSELIQLRGDLIALKAKYGQCDRDLKAATQRYAEIQEQLSDWIDGRFGTDIQVAAHSALVSAHKQRIQVLTQIYLDDLPVRTLPAVMEAFGYNVAKHLIVRLIDGGWARSMKRPEVGLLPQPPRLISTRDFDLYRNLVASHQEPPVPRRDQKPPFAPE